MYVFITLFATAFVSGALQPDHAASKYKSQPEPSPETTELLDDAILENLRASALPMNVRNVLAAMKETQPHLVKHDINSRLYTMKAKKMVTMKMVDGDKAPLWSLA
jgi:hypothetical protein